MATLFGLNFLKIGYSSIKTYNLGLALAMKLHSICIYLQSQMNTWLSKNLFSNPFWFHTIQLIKAQVRRARNYSITVNKPRYSA